MRTPAPTPALALALALALAAQAVTAQERPRPARPFSLTFAAGPVLGGPAAGAMDQLADLGFDDTLTGCFIFCSGPIEHPFFARGARGTVTGRYRWTERWSLGGGVSSGDLGYASGYRESPFGFGDFLDVSWTVRTLWLSGQRELLSGLSVGAGVASHRLRHEDAAGSGAGPFSLTRWGLMAESALALPRRSSRVFWHVGVRGHWVPTSDDVQYGSWSGAVTLRARWSHLVAETGVGIRL